MLWNLAQGLRGIPCTRHLVLPCSDTIAAGLHEFDDTSKLVNEWQVESWAHTRLDSKMVEKSKTGYSSEEVIIGHSCIQLRSLDAEETVF